MMSRTFTSPRHTTHYWEAGPADGPILFFLHGWPGIGLMWRAQMESFASAGWRCIAPDMRGYGGSSRPVSPDAYSIENLAGDMIELHDHLGARPAIWAGHDLGSPVVGALAAHHAPRVRAAVFVSLPYMPESFGLGRLLPLVNRTLYPVDEYPNGQWDYYHFYRTHFEQTVADFDADLAATLATIYRSSDPSAMGRVYRSALVTRNGGWFGSAHRAPKVHPDAALWPPADFDALVEAFRVTGFRSGNAWYLNDDANAAYARTAPDKGRLDQPVLFVNGRFDHVCDISRSALGEPMRRACADLTVTTLSSGHWLALERKAELVEVIQSWLEQKGLSQR